MCALFHQFVKSEANVGDRRFRGECQSSPHIGRNDYEGRSPIEDHRFERGGQDELRCCVSDIQRAHIDDFGIGSRQRRHDCVSAPHPVRSR